MASKGNRQSGCHALASAVRRHYPKAFKSMQDLCSCALAELRLFQTLVHAGILQEATDYEEFMTPPYACRAEDEPGILYEELVHEALAADMTSDDLAADLGVDTLEDGLTACMTTTNRKALQFVAIIDEYDTSDALKSIACKEGLGEDNAEDAVFFSCRCVVTACMSKEGDVESEEEAEFTDDGDEEDDDDDDDDDFDPGSEEEEQKANQQRKRKGGASGREGEKRGRKKKK